MNKQRISCKQFSLLKALDYWYRYLRNNWKWRKWTKNGFSSNFVSVLGARLLINMLEGKGEIATIQWWRVIRADKGTIRAGKDF